MIRKPDGSCRWYRWTARRITTAAGAEFQAVGIDLTERRQAESDRAAIERKMQDAQRLEALGVLAGGVAHDFNNLLAGVLGHAELAASALPDGHPARDHLATVISGVAQAGGLTRQLLAYSGKGRFLLRSLNLNDVIAQTTELLRLTLPKKVQLNLQLAENLPADHRRRRAVAPGADEPDHQRGRGDRRPRRDGDGDDHGARTGWKRSAAACTAPPRRGGSSS